MRERARALRVNATDCERRLWNALRNRKLGGWKWRRQVAIGPYVVDFICLKRNLAVELDGGQHSERIVYDAKRTAFLQQRGLTVMRF